MSRAACTVKPAFAVVLAIKLTMGLMADQRTATPVLRNETEQAMFDLVPFAGARRKVADEEFFGAGIKTGQVIGATDRLGAYPIRHPTHPNDILATVYHLLGFDPHETMIPDRTGRPMRLTVMNGYITNEDPADL